MKIATISDFRKAMRHGPYTELGAYPCYLLMADGGAISFEAARENAYQILWSLRDNINDGWLPVAMVVNWEDENLTCEHTGKKIPSAYGGN